jgi:hypothetical protein
MGSPFHYALVNDMVVSLASLGTTMNLLARNGLNVLYSSCCEEQVAYALFVLLIALS